MKDAIEIPVPKGTKGIIFDLDGTLIDSMPLHFAGYQYALEPWGVKYPEETFLHRAGMPSTDTMEMIRDDFSLENFDVTYAMQRKRTYVNQHLDQIVPIKAMFDLMKSNYGNLPMSIGTGSNRKMVDILIAMLGIDQYIKDIVTSDDVSNHKPSPDTFLKCATLMGIDAEHCTVYEDGILGIQAAQEAGMKVIDVNQYLG